MRALALPLLLLCFLPGVALGWGSNVELPPVAPVVDELGLLQPGEQRQLDAFLRDIKAKSGVEIVVFIASSLRDRAIEDFSIAAAEQWKLGRKKEDRGLLLVVAPKERKMRFEVGYGLEGDITDVFSRRVLDDTMRPLFREGRYYEGIVAGIARLQEKIPLGLSEEQVAGPQFERSIPIQLIFFVIIFLIFVLPAFLGIFGLRRRGFISPHRYGGGWGGSGGWGGGGFGGGSSGGSWGGGGGSFGGGGSSSSW